MNTGLLRARGRSALSLQLWFLTYMGGKLEATPQDLLLSSVPPTARWGPLLHVVGTVAQPPGHQRSQSA